MSEQEELPGMPEETELGAAAKKFVAVKEEIAEAKLAIVEIEKEILKEMVAAGVDRFRISWCGENYAFEIVNSETSVRCAKITKGVRKSEPAKEVEETVAA